MSKAAKRPLSTKPKHYTETGLERYCSPACGGHCTRASYLVAKQRASLLAAKLGKGWTPEIWENLGWHYLVKLSIPGAGGGAVQMYCQAPDRYWLSVVVGGHQYTVTRDTPAKARNAVRLILSAHMNGIAQVVRAVTP